MFERERPDPQTDIEFDFFDESPTVEEGGRGGEGTPPRRRRRMPTRPPGGGSNPSLLRLGLLIGGAILLAAVLVLTVNNCRGNQKKAKYQDYMEAVNGPASESAQVGKGLNTLLTTPGKKLADLRSELEGLRQRQAQIVSNADALDAPGPLREEQQSLVEAMQFRVNGLTGLSAALAAVQGTPSTAKSGEGLAVQAQRLIASDVVYQDLFQAGSAAVMKKEGVTGVPVPASVFVTNTDFGSPTFWKQTVDRLTQSPQAGGLHGNQITSVVVQPGNQRLSTSEDNTVLVTDRLSFQVNVKNSGDSQETQVLVTLTIQQDPVIKRPQTIPVISPGETKTVIFKDLPAPTFGSPVNVKVSVDPVSGETNTSNNSYEYPVIFSLG
ncbi:MAG TPA: CARDB domain-containing protein [Gaiellaceae bacterium]|nr:CARDB domain-containing protein [Gaiellaceae bacterium]